MKTIKDGQTKLPDLDGDMVKGYESGYVFRARAVGSMWTNLQQIQHLETQDVVMVAGKSTPREPRSWRRANDMLEDVKKRVVKGILKSIGCSSSARHLRKNTISRCRELNGLRR